MRIGTRKKQEVIINMIANHYQIEEDEIRGFSTDETIVEARSVAVYLIKTMSDIPAGQMTAFEERPVFTLRNYVSDVATMCGYDNLFAHKVDDLRERAKSLLLQINEREELTRELIEVIKPHDIGANKEYFLARTVTDYIINNL